MSTAILVISIMIFFFTLCHQLKVYGGLAELVHARGIAGWGFILAILCTIQFCKGS